LRFAPEPADPELATRVGFGAKPEAAEIELELPLSSLEQTFPARANSLLEFPVRCLRIPCYRAENSLL